ncbi:MAG: ABC transporter substrate-binding protein, partial [Actinomycetota bacterium]|nr:ABC transporter substrate-binding protein [Actinomycetota bacterium]
MRKSNLLKLLSIIFAFALIAAACGSDDDDSGSSSDSSVLGEEEAPAEEEASASEPADKEEGHSDDDGHDHSDDEDHSDEPAGTADDSLNGDGAELWESIVDGGAVAADDSLEPILVTLINIEGTPVGSFPEIREGMEAAVETVNNTMGGMMGRPVELDSCVHGLDPNEAVACANGVADAQPQLHIQGIDFFNPVLWPTLTGAGLAIMQTVPIFIEDFNTPGIISTEGGCVSSFPSAMQYSVETLNADKFVIIYSDTGPGLVCYQDTQERMIQQLTDDGAIAQEDWIGVSD